MTSFANAASSALVCWPLQRIVAGRVLVISPAMPRAISPGPL
jgi:hypothetical protein